MSSAVFPGISHSIQSDFISAISATVTDEIKVEAQSAPFFA